MTRHSDLCRFSVFDVFRFAAVFSAWSLMTIALATSAQAQSLSRTVVVTQTQASGFGARALHGTRTTTTLRQTLVYRETAPLPGAIIPFTLLPAVAGIRQTPVAPPTVYRIAGPRTAMHEADERRMQQINPGARVVTPDDVDFSRQTRRRYAVRDPGAARADSGPKNSGSRVIVIFPE